MLIKCSNKFQDILIDRSIQIGKTLQLSMNLKITMKFTDILQAYKIGMRLKWDLFLLLFTY